MEITSTASETLRLLFLSPLTLAPSPKPAVSSWVPLKADLGAGESVWGWFAWRHQVAQCPVWGSFSKLIMLIGALRFLKPAMFNTSASSLAQPRPSAVRDPLQPYGCRSRFMLGERDRPLVCLVMGGEGDVLWEYLNLISEVLPGSVSLPP